MSAVRVSRQRAPTETELRHALSGRGNPKISTLAAMAEAVDVPLWVLFIPNLQPTDLQSPQKERLVALVNTYLQRGRGENNRKRRSAGKKEVR